MRAFPGLRQCFIKFWLEPISLGLGASGPEGSRSVNNISNTLWLGDRAHSLGVRDCGALDITGRCGHHMIGRAGSLTDVYRAHRSRGQVGVPL